MAKQEWQIGDVKVTVELPDDVQIRGVAVRVRPMDRAAFLRAAEAVGGLTALTMPTTDERWPQDATVCAQRADGTVDAATYVAIEEPPRERQAEPPKPAHPFFGPLHERVERDQRDAGDEGDGSDGSEASS